MRKARSGVLLLAVLAVVTAGCSGSAQEAPLSEEERVLQSTGVRGQVTDDSLVPIEDAVVWLHTDKRHVRTGADGSYEFVGLEQGEHVLSVEKYGFASATFRVQVWTKVIAELDFPLKPVPTGEPFYKIFPLAGFITCQTAVGSVPQDTVYVECGLQVQGVQEDVRRQDVEFDKTAWRVLSELSWEPITPVAKRLTFAIADAAEGGQSQPFLEVQEGPGARVFMVRGTLNLMYPQGGTLQVYVRAAPSIDEHGLAAAPLGADQHPPLSAGLAVQQEFDIYSTVFHYSHGAPGFTALQ